MRKAAIIAAALFLGSGVGPAQAQPENNPSKDATARAPGAAIVRISLVERPPAVTRGQIAACANLAAVRALDAKAVGAGYAAQDRILDLTFVLCMAGPQTAD